MVYRPMPDIKCWVKIIFIIKLIHLKNKKIPMYKYSIDILFRIYNELIGGINLKTVSSV